MESNPAVATGVRAGAIESPEVRAQLIAAVYERAISTIYANAAVAALSIAVIWRSSDFGWLATLLIGAAVLTAMRLALVRAHRRAKPTPSAAAPWGIYFAVTVSFWGVFWGAMALLVFGMLPPDAMRTAFFVSVIAGVSAGAASALSAYPPAAFAILVPLLSLTALGFLAGTNESRFAFAGIAMIYLAGQIAFVRNAHRHIAESVALRFDNLHLIDELRGQKQAAEQANNAKTRFLAAASHDLRQPLHAMGLFVSALEERVRGAAARKLVDQLKASTDALRELLDGLLDISRLDAGVIQPRISDCSVQALFDRLNHDYAAVADEKKLRLVFAPTCVAVRGDAALLERIVRNLLSNALRYTERGGVVVGARRRGTDIRMEVYDTGIGIHPNEIGNIFREFYQIGNPERDRSKGLGLGLAIAARLAQLLDSQLDVVSVPGTGSRFSLSLPRSTVPATHVEMPSKPAPGRLTSAVVVVIDDERAILDATHTLLEGWGCHAVLADSGASACTALARERRQPDVIVADYRLRNGESGLDAIKALHAEYGTAIPAIVITGDTAPDRLRDAKASGYHVLAKPLAPAQLRALLSHLLVEKRAAARG